MKALGLVLSLAVVSPAAAQPGMTAPMPLPPLPPPATDVVVERYGASVFAVDAASLAAVVIGAALESAPLASLGGVGLFLGAPILHGSKGEGGRGVLSLLGRVGGAGVGIAIGASALDDGSEWGAVAGAFLGGCLGLGTVMVIDAVTARTERVVVRAPAVVPTFAATADGVRVGAAWTW